MCGQNGTLCSRVGMQGGTAMVAPDSAIPLLDTYSKQFQTGDSGRCKLQTDQCLSIDEPNMVCSVTDFG